MKKKKTDPQKREQFMKELWRDAATRQKGYRERALKLFPHVCGSCGREFSGKRLRELTVHHKDHNHNNNPPDGSNWELLCIYCHDHEHEKWRMKGFSDGVEHREESESIFQPFEGLDQLINLKNADEDTK